MRCSHVPSSACYAPKSHASCGPTSSQGGFLQPWELLWGCGWVREEARIWQGSGCGSVRGDTPGQGLCQAGPRPQG